MKGILFATGIGRTLLITIANAYFNVSTTRLFAMKFWRISALHKETLPSREADDLQKRKQKQTKKQQDTEIDVKNNTHGIYLKYGYKCTYVP